MAPKKAEVSDDLSAAVQALVEHGLDSAWHRSAMRRIAEGQLLMASSTTEAGIGGNMRVIVFPWAAVALGYDTTKASALVGVSSRCTWLVIST